MNRLSAEQANREMEEEVEGIGIGKGPVRQVQDSPPQGACAGDLRRREAQAAAGLTKA